MDQPESPEWSSGLRESHEQVAVLESVVHQQRARIEELEKLLKGYGCDTSSVAEDRPRKQVTFSPAKEDEPANDCCQQQADEEIQELRAIVDAQEAALLDQRQIIQNQSSLIDDLNTQMQKLLMAQQCENSKLAEESSQPMVQPHASEGLTGSMGNPLAGGSRRRLPVSTRSSSGAKIPLSARTHREHREELLAQKLRSERSPRDLPRPNSALGKSGAAPRAQSWTSGRASSAGTQQGRGISPGPSTAYQVISTTTTAATTTRKSCSTLPPTLPQLRREA